MSQKLTAMETKLTGNEDELNLVLLDIARTLTGPFPEDLNYPVPKSLNDIVKEHKRISTYITNPAHGGKITCEKCNGFILEGEDSWVLDKWDIRRYFHTEPCFNRYEHYYGFNRPID